MKPIELYKELMALPAIASIITSVQFHHKTAPAHRKQILNIISRHLDQAYGVRTIGVFKSGYVRDANAWINGNRLNLLIKGVGYTPAIGWSSEMQSITRILIRNGFSRWVNARNTAKNLFKPFNGDYQRFYGRNGDPQYLYTGANNIDREEWLNSVISAGMKVFAQTGQYLSHDKDRIDIRFSRISNTGFYFHIPKYSPSNIFFYVNTKEISKDKFNVTINFRHITENRQDFVTRRLSDHLQAALCSMPHASNISTRISSVDSAYHRDILTINFDFVFPQESQQPVPEEIKPMITSPAELSNASNISEADIEAFLNRRIVELSDDLGVLYNQRDMITEQIEQKTHQQRKFKQILEAL